MMVYFNRVAVRVAEYDLRNKTACDGHGKCITEQEYEIEKSIKHEKYGKKCARNDIALLKLKESITFSKYVSTVCLPIDIELDKSQNLTTAGFGMTEDVILSDVMLKTEVFVVNHKQCIEDYKNPKINFTVDQGHLCARGFNGSDS